MIGVIGWDYEKERAIYGPVTPQGEPIVDTPKKNAPSTNITPRKSSSTKGRRKKRKRSIEVQPTYDVDDTKSDTQSPPRKKSRWLDRSRKRSYGNQVTPDRGKYSCTLSRSRRNLQNKSAGDMADDDYSTTTNVVIDDSPLPQHPTEEELQSLRNKNAEHIKALKDLSQGLAELEKDYNNSKKQNKEIENEINSLGKEKRQYESQIHDLEQRIQQLSEEHNVVLTKQTRTTEDLRGSVKSLEDELEYTKKIHQATIDSMQADKKYMEKDMQFLQAQRKLIEQKLTAQVRSLARDNIKLQLRKQSDDKKILSLQLQKESADGQLLNKDKQMSEMKKDEETLKTEMEKLKCRMHESEAVITKLKDKISKSNRRRSSDSLTRINKSTVNNRNNKGDSDLLKGLDKELIEKINNDIVDSGEQVSFNDIAGLKNAKDTVNEMVIMPMLRPELFTGLRSCPKGLLLFGPPGTGKTLIGKAIAHKSGATFFNVTASSLASKWIGDGEKLVRTLFAMAHYRAPSVVFIDEIDSVLTQRKADEHEASRKMKTEFLVQLDGAGNARTGQVLVIGATNLPQELDDAALRRFVKRLYIPLPDQAARQYLIQNLLKNDKNTLSNEEVTKLSHNTHGFSGADLKALCTDAAMAPLRKLGNEVLETMDATDVPPITYKHFKSSLRSMNPSVAEADLTAYIEWNNTYGNTCTNDDSQDSDGLESEDE